MPISSPNQHGTGLYYSADLPVQQDPLPSLPHSPESAESESPPGNYAISESSLEADQDILTIPLLYASTCDTATAIRLRQDQAQTRSPAVAAEKQHLPFEKLLAARGISLTGHATNLNFLLTRARSRTHRTEPHSLTTPFKDVNGLPDNVEFDVISIEQIKAKLDPQLVHVVDILAGFLSDYADPLLQKGEALARHYLQLPVMPWDRNSYGEAAQARITEANQAEAEIAAGVQPEQAEGERQLALLEPLFSSDDLYAYRSLLNQGFFTPDLSDSDPSRTALDETLGRLARQAQDAATAADKTDARPGANTARLAHTLSLACKGDLSLSRDVLDYLGTIALGKEIARAYTALGSQDIRNTALPRPARGSTIANASASMAASLRKPKKLTMSFNMQRLTPDGRAARKNGQQATPTATGSNPGPATMDDQTRRQEEVIRTAWHLVFAMHQTPDAIAALAIVSRPHDEHYDFFAPVVRSFMQTAKTLAEGHTHTAHQPDFRPATVLQGHNQLSSTLYLGLLAQAQRTTYKGPISGFAAEDAQRLPDGAPDAALLTPLQCARGALARCGIDGDSQQFRAFETLLDEWCKSAASKHTVFRISPFASLRDEALAFTRTGNMAAFKAAASLLKTLHLTLSDNNSRLITHVCSADRPVAEFEHLTRHLRRDLIRQELTKIWQGDGFLRSLKGHELFELQKEDIIQAVNQRIAALFSGTATEGTKNPDSLTAGDAAQTNTRTEALKNALSPALVERDVASADGLYLTPSLADSWLHDALYSHVAPSGDQSQEEKDAFYEKLQFDFMKMKNECAVLYGDNGTPILKKTGSEKERRESVAHNIEAQLPRMFIGSSIECSIFSGKGFSTKNLLHVFLSAASLGGQVRFTPQVTVQDTLSVKFGMAGNSTYITLTRAGSHQEQGSFGGIVGPRFELPANVSLTLGGGAEYNLYRDTIHAEGMTLRLDRLSLPARGARPEILERGGGDSERTALLGKIIGTLIRGLTPQDKRNGLRSVLMKVLSLHPDRLHVNLFGKNDDYRKVAIHTISGRVGLAVGAGPLRTGPTGRVLRGYRNESEERKEAGASYSLHTRTESHYRQTSLGVGWGALALNRVNDHQAQGIGSIDAAVGSWDLDIQGHANKKTVVKVYEQYAKNTSVLNTYATYKEYYEKMMANLDKLTEQYLEGEIQRQNKARPADRTLTPENIEEMRGAIRNRLLGSLAESLHFDLRKTQSFAEFNELSAARTREINTAHTTDMLAGVFGHSLLQKAAQARKEQILADPETWVFQFGMVTQLMSDLTEYGIDALFRLQRGHREIANTLISFIAAT